MNLLELRNLTRASLLDMVVPYKWSDEFINSALNRALIEVEARTEASRTPSVHSMTIPYTGGDKNPIKVPSGVLSIISARAFYYTADTEIGIPHEVCVELKPTAVVPMDKYKVDWRGATTLGPTHFVALDGEFLLYPTPMDSGTLALVVSSSTAPRLEQDSDVVKVDPSRLNKLVDWVLYEAFRLQGTGSFVETALEKLRSFEECFGPPPSVNSLRVRSILPRETSVYMHSSVE